VTVALLTLALVVLFLFLIREDQQAAGPSAHDIDRHPSNDRSLQ